MYWKMGKGAWVGLDLHFTRNWMGHGMQHAFPRLTLGTLVSAADRASVQGDDEDEEMFKLRRRARLLRLSEV